MTTQLLILENILWLPLCRINKFGFNNLPSKTVAIPYTCGLSEVSLAVMRLVEGWGTTEDGGTESPEGMCREARVEEVMAPEEGEPIEQLYEMA